jgi:membrane protein YdbS with pleckstrin-like domain
MHCPACGADCVEQAVYCHKCGERLDTVGQEYPGDVPEAPPAANDAQDAPAADVRERLEQGATARRSSEDEEEQEIWEGGYSPKAMIGAWLLSGLVTLVLLVVGFTVWRKWVWIAVALLLAALWLFQVIKLTYRRLNIRYRLTNQRLVHETGILKRVTDRIETIDMDDITYEQKFIERFVGVGTVIISSTDRTHPELRLIGIENVKKVADQMDDIRRSERRRRGLHIESI